MPGNGARRMCTYVIHRRSLRVELFCRRVWGQRPGQPCATVLPLVLRARRVGSGHEIGGWIVNEGQKSSVRVILADDQALFRRGINAVLTGEDDIEVVAEAEDGKSAIDLAEEFVPDVVLMDVRMPGIGGIEAARQIKASCPSTAILMLTVSDEEDDLYEAIKAGANGYLLKEVSIATVATAIRDAMNGESFLSPTMASKLLTEFSALSRREEQPPAPNFSSLTQREIEVLQFVALGETNRKIAEKLGISENTVKNHVRNILEKLHLHDRMAAAMYAVEAQLLNPAD
jgi:DNA-binding NarL/FixJ family response regulator